MGIDRVELVMHPVRIRVVQALVRRRHTTNELRELLPDIPQATLYRQLAKLVEGGVVEVAEERRVRGTVERAYVLRAAILSPEDVATATKDEHLAYFSMFTSTLLAEFAAYLDRGSVDIAADRTSYQYRVLHLDDAEFEALFRAMSELLRPHLDNEPSPDRTPRLFATALFPVADDQSR